MALIDKVKAQASQLAQKAQEAGKAGQAKLEEAQARRRADLVLRQLGAAYYAQLVGRSTGDSESEIDRLTGLLSAWESEHGPLSGAGADDSSDADESEGDVAP